MANPAEKKTDELPAHIRDALAEQEREDLSDIKERLEEAEKPAKDELDEVTKKRMQRNYTFEFEWPPAPKKGERPANERVWKGVFTNTVANIRLRRQIGVTRAELAQGVEFEVMDPFTREINLILAHLTWTLDCTANAEGHWSRDLQGLDDYEVLQALYQEVVAHEATFLGRI